VPEPGDAVACYVCAHRAGRYRRRIDDRFSIYKCAQCGLEYTDPAPSDDELRAFYADYRDIRADPRVVAANARRHIELLEEHGWTPASPILDFGAGDGLFVEAAGPECFGVEWRPTDLSRIAESLDAFSDRLWDAITLWGVLEHLPVPHETIRDLVARLAPHGLIALTTVDAESIIPYYYRPPEHLSYWTRAAFDVLAEVHGLQIVVYEPYTMVQLSEVYVDRLLSRTPTDYRPQVRSELPLLIEVPTNEVRVLLRRR
jgi:Methyltransferase domain